MPLAFTTQQWRYESGRCGCLQCLQMQVRCNFSTHASPASKPKAAEAAEAEATKPRLMPGLVCEAFFQAPGLSYAQLLSAGWSCSQCRAKEPRATAPKTSGNADCCIGATCFRWTVQLQSSAKVFAADDGHSTQNPKTLNPKPNPKVKQASRGDPS